MANTVRKVKRGKNKEAHINVPFVGNPQAISDTKRQPELENKTVYDTTAANQTHDQLMKNPAKNNNQQVTTSINVTELIAELTENAQTSKTDTKIIEKPLIQQANGFLKVNANANQNAPKIVDATQKYSSASQPIYGRIPANNCSNLKPIIKTGGGLLRQISRPAQSRVTQGEGTYDTVQSRLAEQKVSPPGASDTLIVPVKLQQENKMMNAVYGFGGIPGTGAKASARVEGSYTSGLRTGSFAARAHAVDVSARETPLQESVSEARSPPYRMPPAPEAALPGAPAPALPAALHTHSAKFPIEREVILSSGDKGSKVPILQEARKRGRLGAVAPDTPPKALSAWTHAENQQAGPSGENYRYHHEHPYGYTMQNQGAIPRNQPGYEPSQKPPVPAKNNSIYAQKMDTPNNNTQSITVTVETAKDTTKDAPKSNKSVSKTYHTLKDLISSRFKNKDNGDLDKHNENEGLNNSEERKRSEEPTTPRENGVRKVDQGIYGRPIPQNRPETQYGHAPPTMAYANQPPHRQLMQQQMVQQQMMMNHQARSQEILHSPHQQRPMTLGADALYQQYGPPGRRSAVYQRDMDVRNMTNFTSLKQTTPQMQMENHLRADMRSPQQLEREIIRHQGLVVGRRAASQPHLLDEPQQRPEIPPPQIYDRSRRNSHGNLLDGITQENGPPKLKQDERESDDGGFRTRHSQGRNNYEERIRTSGRSIESHRAEPVRIQDNVYRRTPDQNMKEARRTPDSLNHRGKEDSIQINDRNDESASQKSVDSVYNSSKGEGYTQPTPSRQTPSRIEDLKAHGKKGAAGSGASSDYDKNGGQSSNVDSGRGSVAYSSGRRPDASLHDTSADSDAAAGTRIQPQPGTSHQINGNNPENEWADIVECELRQILEPKLAGMRIDSSGSSVSSVTPPLPPLSPASDMMKRNSLPARAAEYGDDRRRGRESPRWHAHKKHSSKRDHHYKKHLFGLDTTDMTSTTTRSLDLSSLLDGRTDSDASTGDARAIRRQLRGLENMYAEVLQLLGVRKPTSISKAPTWEARLSSKRRYGSMSSLPSSSVSSRPVRDKRRSSEHRKKHDTKGINKRFQRLESHVVTLARSVAHLSSEMRTQHLVMQEMDAIRAEIAALRHMYKSQQYLRSGHHRHGDPYSFSNPDRVKRLTKFFGDEPPLMRLFLKKLGYEKYAALLEKEKVGAAELPYVGEDKLRALGVPLGPRMRILKEAGIHSEIYMPRDDPHNTTTTLAIV